ncbi:MAG: hypothetical protein ACHQU1_00920 [Gemmatimonadales bacterium]
MRLRRFPAGVPLASLLRDRRDAAERAPAEDELLGSWSATRWQYTSDSRPDRVVDVVCDLGGSVTLSLSAGTWVLTWELDGRGSQSLGGALALDGERLLLLARDENEAEQVLFRLADRTLALSCETSAWDFDGNGEEPAAFVAVLVRL